MRNVRLAAVPLHKLAARTHHGHLREFTARPGAATKRV
jgi:hypothetical protein